MNHFNPIHFLAWMAIGFFTWPVVKWIIVTSWDAGLELGALFFEWRRSRRARR